MNFLKKMTFVCIGLQGTLIILWFLPVVKASAGFVSSSEPMSDTGIIFTLIMIALGIASIASLVMPILQDTVQEHRHYIMAKVSAGIYLGLYIIVLIGASSEAKKYYASLDITFWGYLYIAVCVAIIVITSIMSSKTKNRKGF